MKIDLVKYEKRVKAMTPNLFESIVWLLSFISGAIAYDLKLTTLLSVSTFLFLASNLYCFFWLIDSLVYSILKKKQDKINK